MDFMRWVESRYHHPVVMVESSSRVDDACRRNGLDFIQLLRPYCVHNGTLYARPSERTDSVTVRNFGVRLLRPSCVREASYEQVLRYCRRLMHKAAPMDIACGEQLDRVLRELVDVDAGGPKAQPVYLSSSTALQTLQDRATPLWHSEFIQSLHQLLRCSSLDCVDHPVGIIYAASTQEAGGADGVLRVFREQARRPAETRVDMPGMDADLHPYYLLVHDVAQAATAGPSIAEVRQLLAAVQALYGNNYCALIKINAVECPAGVKSMDPAPWVEANVPCLDVPAEAVVRATAAASTSAESGSETFQGTAASLKVVQPLCGTWDDGSAKVTGCYLSPENAEGLQHVMSYYLTQSLFPFLERKLRILSISVHDRRTTTLGKMAAWFKIKEDAKPRMEYVVSRDGKTPPRYTASSLEMQMRRCGDYSLALQDFSSAVHFFKMCRDELIETLPQRPFNRPYIAACQEGIGVASFLLGKLALPSATPWLTGGTRVASKGHLENPLELALNDFVSTNHHHSALRTGFLLVEFCRTRTPPAMDRARAVLQHLLSTGVTSVHKLYHAVVQDMLAATYLYPSGAQPLAHPNAARLPRVYTRVRSFVQHIVSAGSAYLETGVHEMALRCYLRALEVFRALGRRGSWPLIAEHILTTVATLYQRLGLHAKSIVVMSAAIAQGIPMYSDRRVGLQNFNAFWQQQHDVLRDMNYTLCPHMPLPCVIRSSFTVGRNHYGTDADTESQAKLFSEEAMEVEWRSAEDLLRTHYNTTVLKTYPTHTFPHFRSMRSEDRLFTDDAAQTSDVKHTQQQQHQRHYVVPLSEPLALSFTMHNPVGGAITAEKLCVLYMSRAKPKQLWKSSATATIRLAARATHRVTLTFSPQAEGEYVIIGLCWTLSGQEGYYYFATKEARPGCAESLYEYAIDHPMPSINAKENITVTVAPPMAWITTTVDPPLPARLRHGEYFHTTLTVTNSSAHREASCITLQRSPQNAHHIFFELFGLHSNVSEEATLTLAERLKPSEARTFRMTVRAQHNRGDATQRCSNNIFMLIGYLPEAVEPAGGSPTGSSHSTAQASPTGHTAGTGGKVRLHRLFRSCEVRPLMALYSTVLPPANASLATAAVVAAKHIAEPQDPPLRVARCMVMHRPRWLVHCPHLGTLLEDRAVDCSIPPGSSVTLPLNLSLRPHADGEKSSPITPAATTDAGQGPATTPPVDAGYIDQECLPLAVALPSEAQAAQLTACLGGGLANSPMNQYFLRKSYRGAGSVGMVGNDEDGGFVFYLDKAAQAVPTETQRREAEREAERRLFGGPLAQFPPLVVAVSWVVVSDTGQLACGQLFHFIDPVDYLQDPLRLAAGPALQNHTESGGDLLQQEHLPMETVTAIAEQQERRCEAMVNCTSAHSNTGALVYHVQAPDLAETTADMPAAAILAVRLRTLSLSPVPLLVDVVAAEPEHLLTLRPNLPFVFISKTRYRFVLNPGDTHAVEFTAHMLLPGITDVNTFVVKATPLVYQPAMHVYTGMTPRELLSALSAAPQSSILSSAISSPVLSDVALNSDAWSTPHEHGGDAVMNASAATRTAMAIRMLQSSMGDATEAALALLTPSTFLSQLVLVVGHAHPAVVEVRFRHLGAAIKQASIDAFMAKNASYAAELQRFRSNYKKFVDIRSAGDTARPNKNASSTTTQSGRFPVYVYRPLVKSCDVSVEAKSASQSSSAEQEARPRAERPAALASLAIKVPEPEEEAATTAAAGGDGSTPHLATSRGALASSPILIRGSRSTERTASVVEFDDYPSTLDPFHLPPVSVTQASSLARGSYLRSGSMLLSAGSNDTSPVLSPAGHQRTFTDAGNEPTTKEAGVPPQARDVHHYARDMHADGVRAPEIRRGVVTTGAPHSPLGVESRDSSDAAAFTGRVVGSPAERPPVRSSNSSFTEDDDLH